MLKVSPIHRQYEVLPSLNDPSIPAMAPMPAGETADTQRIVERFGDGILAAGVHNGQQIVYVQPDQLLNLAKFLKEDAELAYEALIDVSAVDCSKLPQPLNGRRFQTVYQLRSYERKQHITVICPLENDEEPQVDSLTSVYQGANWPEREVLDLMGITFVNHPDPRRILMPAHWPNHPLRKDMPLGGEEVPFSFTWGDPEFETLGKQVLPAESVPPEVPPGMSRENMIINMGPHHPSTHGVLRLAVELDGETVINVDADLGYLHSGFEKTGENKRYKDFVYYTDRMDYLSSMNNNLGYVLAVEKMLGLEIPERAQVIRVIMSELQRISSHLFWLSTHALDVCGTGMSLLMYATRERERILDRKLSPLYDRYHFILFDCPPNLSRVTINALCASEEVIVPIETQSYSIKAISDLTHTFTLLKRKMGHDLTVWLLPTKVDRSVKIATDILDALDDAFRGRLLDPIHDDPTLIRAPLLCEPITRSYPNAPSALEYARLGRFFTLHDAERAQWMGLTLAERRRIIEKAARDVAEEADLPPAIKKKRLWG